MRMGFFQFAGVLTNIKKEISCKRTQAVTDQQCWTEITTTAQNGSLPGQTCRRMDKQRR